MSEENLSSIDRIDIMRNILDNLVNADGRTKCGYIMVLDEYLNKIREDLLIKEEQIRDLNSNKSETMSPE